MTFEELNNALSTLNRQRSAVGRLEAAHLACAKALDLLAWESDSQRLVILASNASAQADKHRDQAKILENTRYAIDDQMLRLEREDAATTPAN